MSDKINTIFFGTPHFAEIVLQKLINSPYRPSLIITAPDKPTGRKQTLTPPPVKLLSKKHNIPVWQPKKLEVVLFRETSRRKRNRLFSKNLPQRGKSSPFEKPPAGREINKLGKIDLVIVAAYGNLIPKEILDTLPNKFVNIHPSLLPKYRGPSPIANTILNDDKKTGVTIMLMDEKMDHGPLISQREFRISNFEFKNGRGKPTSEELQKILAELGAELLTETIADYLSGKIKPREQDHKEATYTKLLKREDGRIDWKKPAEYIERQQRAFTPWPGIYTYFNGKRLKILSLEIQKNTSAKSGEVIKRNSVFAVQTRKNLIVPRQVQIEGGVVQTAEEFLRGHPQILGSHLT
jgi:methionyl-tRNA formyltransferase